MKQIEKEWKELYEQYLKKKEYFEQAKEMEKQQQGYSEEDMKKCLFLSSTEPAIIQDEFKAYEVSWKCQKGHINFQIILSLGTQNDICLKCGKHYEYTVTQDFT